MRLLPRGRRVVVDDVHAHPQAGRMQAHHHRAQLAHADRAVVRVAGEAAFRRAVVVGVVAPVETVGIGDRHDGGLLRVAVGRGRRHARDRAAALGHGGQVEDRQQVHVGQAGAAQRAQMAHAGRVAPREREVLAALRRGDGRVVAREVAHMQLVDDHVGRRFHPVGDAAGRPAARLQPGLGQIGDIGPRRVGREADRIGIGHQVADPADAGHEDLDEVAVVRAAAHADPGDGPDAGELVARHRQAGTGGAVGAVVDAELDAIGGRRPQLEAGAGRRQ